MQLLAVTLRAGWLPFSQFLALTLLVFRVLDVELLCEVRLVVWLLDVPIPAALLLDGQVLAVVLLYEAIPVLPLQREGFQFALPLAESLLAAGLLGGRALV